MNPILEPGIALEPSVSRPRSDSEETEPLNLTPANLELICSDRSLWLPGAVLCALLALSAPQPRYLDWP
jgi:hypothetical protein